MIVMDRVGGCVTIGRYLFSGRMRGVLPGIIACAIMVATLMTVPVSTSAQEPGVAGLVISYGNSAYSYAVVPVPADGERFDGVDLLEQSGLPVLAIDFGGYGQGVCKIEVVGCDVSACRVRLCQTGDSASPFWRYLLGGETGWTMSPLGASGSPVEAGKVYGWAWSGGQGVPADMPTLSLQDVMARSGFDSNAAPLRPALRSIGLSGTAAPSESSSIEYAGAGFILAALGGAGWMLVRRARQRAGIA